MVPLWSTGFLCNTVDAVQYTSLYVGVHVGEVESVFHSVESVHNTVMSHCCMVVTQPKCCVLQGKGEADPVMLVNPICLGRREVDHPLMDSELFKDVDVAPLYSCQGFLFL